MAETDSKDESGRTDVAAEGADAEATRISQPGSAAVDTAGDGAPELTQYTGATQQTAGFQQAAELAARASAEQGRLLKKRFVLEDVIGEGGMGRVYKARDLRKVEAEDRNPYVAVKVLGQGFREHPEAFVALQQESVKSQKLAHPNIVTVHDFDRDGDTIYMTMELLKGDPLDGLLRLQAPLAREVALRYFRDLCAGLQYAHERGLIHSDLKPGNIFVTTGGVVKILDFGIARAATRNALSHDYDVGSLGALTPAYATIEMVEGQAPSPGDDVYALACVLYVMLTGEHPYARKSAAEARRAGLKPTRPECLNSREWAALRAALEVDASRRPASIAAFREQLIPPARTRKLWLPVVGAVLLIAAGAGIWAYQQQRAAALAESRAQAEALAREQAEAQNRAEAEARAQRLADALRESNGCLLQEDYDCAIERALIVREMAPDNAEASAIIEAAREGRARQQAAREITAQVERARACLAEMDIACATVAIGDAREGGARADTLAPLEQQLDALKQTIADEAAARRREMGDWLRTGRECLAEEDYACAEERAARVMERDPGNPEATDLAQQTRRAREERAFRERTVAGFLAEAEQCFEQRDYSCSIAKAESALAIIGGHEGAQEMIERAQSAQEAAKKAIRIQ